MLYHFQKKKEKWFLFTQMLLHSEHSSQTLSSYISCIHVFLYWKINMSNRKKHCLVSWFHQFHEKNLIWFHECFEWFTWFSCKFKISCSLQHAWRYFNFQVVGPFCSVHFTIKLNGNHKRFNFEVFFFQVNLCFDFERVHACC